MKEKRKRLSFSGSRVSAGVERELYMSITVSGMITEHILCS